MAGRRMAFCGEPANRWVRTGRRQLTKLWLGQSKQTVIDYYPSGLSKDLVWQQEWCKRVGLGFSLVGLHRLQNVVPIDGVKVA